MVNADVQKGKKNAQRRKTLSEGLQQRWAWTTEVEGAWLEEERQAAVAVDAALLTQQPWFFRWGRLIAVCAWPGEAAGGAGSLAVRSRGVEDECCGWW